MNPLIMNIRALGLTALLLAALPTLAQNFDGFNYQAVVRDAAGEPIPSQAVGVQVIIVSGILQPHVEVHSVTTDAHGLMKLVIGEGQLQSGPAFSAIDWSDNTAWTCCVSVDITGGTSYTSLGCETFKAVPFAMHALTSGGDPSWVVSGDTLYNNGRRVGIGTSSPDTTLHVVGKLKYQDGTEGEGKVLQSDAAGNGTWVLPGSILPTNNGATVVEITASNTNAFVVPEGIHSIRIEALGGSGGGGGSGSAQLTGTCPDFCTAVSGRGGGGGGGEYGASIIAVTPGDVVGVTIGPGGAAGLGGNSNGTAGTAGGATIVTLNGVPVLTVNGGAGGGGGEAASCNDLCHAMDGTPGSGGTGSAAAIEIAGSGGSGLTGGASATTSTGASATGGNGGPANSIHNYDASFVAGSNGAPGVAGRMAVSHVNSANASTPHQTGSIVFAGSAGEFATNPSKLFWNNSSLRMGIGTAAPGSTLSVGGNISVGSSYSGSVAPTDGAIVQGRLGVGTNDPSYQLDVQAPGTAGLVYAAKLTNRTTGDNNQNSAGLLFAVESYNNSGKGALVYERNASHGRGKFHFLQNTVAGIGNPALSDAVMTIDNAGSVGIGTSTPEHKLDVNGIVRIKDHLTFNSANGVVNWGPSGTLHFRTLNEVGNNTDFNDRMAITASGNVGIGVVTPDEKLVVEGGRIKTSVGYTCKAGINGGYGNAFNFFWTGASLQAWIDNVNVGTVQFTSDRRLKEHISPITTSAIDRVKLLKPVTYNYRKVEGSIFTGDSVQHEGFIADELQAVIPSAVNGEKNARTADGGIQPQTVNSMPVISVLTKAIQEQQALIEEQRARIAALEAGNSAKDAALDAIRAQLEANTALMQQLQQVLDARIGK